MKLVKWLVIVLIACMKVRILKKSINILRSPNQTRKLDNKIKY